MSTIPRHPALTLAGFAGPANNRKGALGGPFHANVIVLAVGMNTMNGPLTVPMPAPGTVGIVSRAERLFACPNTGICGFRHSFQPEIAVFVLMGAWNCVGW